MFNKNTLIIILFAFSAAECNSKEKMKIIYVYDALCGWCYGFSPVINQFQEKYKSELTFEVFSGGMVTGNRVDPIGEVAQYISWAYKDVEKATGVTFGTDFLDKTLKNGTAIFTSIPPAIALSVFKTIDNESLIQFAVALQKAIYFDGIEPENYEAYGNIAEGFGLNATEFKTKMKQTTNLKLAEADFVKSTQLGVSGFPTVFLESKGKFYKIGNGFLTLNELERNYVTIKNKLQ